jgi:putative ABC transport system permease protein
MPLSELPPLDAVVISHDHYDHLDTATIAALAARDVPFVVPLGVGAHLEYWGVAASRIVELDWWGTTRVGRAELVATPARHFSGRSLLMVYFFDGQHQDVTVALDEPRTTEIVNGFARLPGVMTVEHLRTVPVRFRFGHRNKRETITGITPDNRMTPVYDSAGRILSVPEDGLLMSTALATVLGVKRGDVVAVEVLEGNRPVRRIPVVALFETYIGTPAYMSAAAVHRMMNERPVTNLIQLRVDARDKRALYRRLKELPVVTAVMLRMAAVRIFHETMARTMWIFIGFFIAFSCAMAFGVVFNSARIALSERGRELATLRVIGFTKLEIAYILLGEVALITVLALPIGCIVGYLLSGAIVAEMATELFRVPLVIEHTTYGLALTIGLAATVVSAAMVGRRLGRLDLIRVLKTRE